MHILYVGETFPGSNALARASALRREGHNVDVVDEHRLRLTGRLGEVVEAATLRCGHPVRALRVSRETSRRLNSGRYEVLWVDKGNYVHPHVIREVASSQPRPKLVLYSPDDMTKPHNQSAFFRRAVGLYDLHVTTKHHATTGLYALGARRVLFVWKAFDPCRHFPESVTPPERHQYGGPVGFIGAFERERAQTLRVLAEHGVPVRIWGWTDWSSLNSHSPHLRVEGRPLWDREYRTAISAFDINLCFLRKINTDQHTCRTMEIPACGGFMLAERTDEHRELFQEGKEAEFFDSDAECLDKVRFYLARPALRLRIAAAGRERCITSQYDLGSHVTRVLTELFAHEQ